MTPHFDDLEDFTRSRSSKRRYGFPSETHVKRGFPNRSRRA